MSASPQTERQSITAFGGSLEKVKMFYDKDAPVPANGHFR